ncbi:MAG: class I SAM-dependent methyltransferase [Proteobacteria bacterium]|nr:class I SAM-dependent methyltransferase [Pseudomonadota bacterium]
MSGFSPEWLALREPADLTARNRHVMNACARAFADQDSINVCDIGAGTGASVRALVDLLPRRQFWTLVDSDENNLSAAFQQLARWGSDVKAYDGGLMLRKGDRQLYVRTHACDLAATPACWPKDTDLVTASALFDLTSARWLDAFVARLAAQKVSLLSMLTFDGSMAAEPEHPLDRAVADAFCGHQQRDKGFGPAAGPRAAEVLEATLETAGYEIEVGESPWAIDRGASALLYATLAGIAAAVQEMQTIPPEDIEQWLRASVINTRLLTIGHRDVFAKPRAG